MEIIKRILKVTIWVFCYPPLIPAVFCIPVIAIFAVGKYIFTGKQDFDIIYTPFYWVVALPDRIIKKLGI